MQSRRLAWQLNKAAWLAKRALYRRLYRDSDPDPGRAIMVAGAARSGTTWLAEIIGSQVPCRLMFEPFNPDLIHEYRDFNYFQYMRSREENSSLQAYCTRLFCGGIRNAWIDRQVSCLFPRRRLIKSIRASLLLHWIRHRFPEVPVVLMMRHPCAVVLSRMRLRWATDTDIQHFLCQPKLVEDFLQNRMGLIERAQTDEAKHAIIWCVSNLVPLQQLQAGNLTVVFYEWLHGRPETEIPRVFEAINERYSDSVFDSMRKPSRTSQAFSAVVTGGDFDGWSKKLSPQQIDTVLSVVEAFGLDYIYGDSRTPQVTELPRS